MYNEGELFRLVKDSHSFFQVVANVHKLTPEVNSLTVGAFENAGKDISTLDNSGTKVEWRVGKV